MISLETRAAAYGAWLAFKAARQVKATPAETLEIVALGVLTARRRMSPTARILFGQLLASVKRAKLHTAQRVETRITYNGRLWWQY